MKLYTFFILFICLFSASEAQVKLLQKKYDNNSITYTVQNIVTYSITKNNNKSIINFQDYMDESKPGELKLPSRDLFLAIPFDSNPNAAYESLSGKKIKAFPGLNPNTTTVNEKIVYEESIIPRYSPKQFLEVKGKLWIEDNYCLHIKINPFLVDAKNDITYIEKFKLVITFDSNINFVESNNDVVINDLILDKQFAAGVKVARDIYVSKNDEWIDYNKTYLKLGTSRDGIYRLHKADIESSGISTSSINPKTFKLFLNGEEVPIFVEGEDDLSFDETDFIEFLGLRNMGGNHRYVSNYDEPYNEYLGRYTDTTVYWLTWGDTEGERIVTSNQNSVPAADTLYYYSQIEHYETNIWYDFSINNSVRREMPYWTENKTWHQGNLGVGTTNKSFTVSDVYPDRPFKMFVKLQDYASNITSKAHLLTLGLNSTEQWSDSTFIDKYQQAVLSTELNSDFLQDGGNTLKIKSILTSASINACIFDWYEIEYPRYLKAINDSLVFQFSFLTDVKEWNIKITNISDTQVVMWKKGAECKKFFVNVNDGEIVFNDTLKPQDKFVLTKENLIVPPKIYYAKQFKNLRSIENKADYIAVTHKKFLAKVNEYCKFISNNYNISAIAVDIDDIYDEYAFGFFNPEAIKEFLKSTHNFWQTPKPNYVVLIGGATYDFYGDKFKNLSSVKERVINYVPSFGGPVSDNWFVTWDTTGAYIPQMNIGRLPVTTNSQLEWYFNKHQEYVSQDYDDWNKRYMFFSSGDAASQSEINLLRESNQFVIDNYVITKPIGGKYEHFYKTVDPQTNFGPYTDNYFQSAVDEGAVFISYLGHSGTQIWDNSITSVSQLGNSRNRYPIISDFGCSTGKFAEADITSFSELFTVGEEGQALVYIGNSSLGFTSTSTLGPKFFYKKILKDSVLTVSEALKQAKLEILQNYGSSDIYKLFALTNTLIGDPIVTLPIPPKPNFVLQQGRLHLSDDVLTDLQDSAELKIYFNNFGTVPDDKLEILIEHTYGGSLDTQSIFVGIPNFEDSIVVNLPIKNKVGRHLVSVQLDSQSKYDELSEDDNFQQIEFNVSSSLIRYFSQYRLDNGIIDKIKFLNPTAYPGEEGLIFEIAEDKEFTKKESFDISFDIISTSFSLENIGADKRWWGRTKIKGSNDYSPSFSFYKNNNKYFLIDGISNTNVVRNTLSFHTNKWMLDSAEVKFEIFSAGFVDGQAAVISRNGINYIPTSLVGHHITLFDAEPPYDFIEYKYFNTFSGGENITNYINFLNTLSNDKLVAIAVSDEGTISNTELKNLIKSFGSQFIDSVKFRSSWAFIGKKGAQTGFMPEAFSYAGDGSVTIDTVMYFPSDSGSLITSEIGVSNKWDKLTVNQETPSNSQITYLPIGIKTDGTVDTLELLKINNSVAELGEIDSKVYPKLKIIADFKVSDDKKSPILYSLGVNYNLPSELATNYQVVSISQDSVNIGENIDLNFDVYNVGESAADSFYVEVDLVNENNTSQTNVLRELVTSIDSLSKKSFILNYNTASLSGSYKFHIKIDTEDKILELYKDNNFYSIPFYVKPDTTKPTMNLTFDGKDIFDGEYISPKPNIKIELTDLSLLPVTDTSSVKIFLDDEPVYYSDNNKVTYTVSVSNPKYVVEFKPELNNGEHSISVFAKDASGNFAEQNGLMKNFIVSNQVKLLDLYNYPNPFSNDTYFTFKLTQIPDEVRIKVYTIAGRLVKEINKTSAELNFDFNKIYWDGRDEDGDLLGNGVYIYRAVIEAAGVSEDITQKLAIVR